MLGGWIVIANGQATLSKRKSDIFAHFTQMAAGPNQKLTCLDLVFAFGLAWVDD